MPSRTGATGRSSFIVTSNRKVSEWVAHFADPILANSALDRLASGPHRLVIEAPSYRTRPAPKGPLEEVRGSAEAGVALRAKGGSMSVAMSGSMTVAIDNAGGLELRALRAWHPRRACVKG